MSAISLLTRKQESGKKIEICYPHLGQPHPTPHSNLGDISGNYKRISTKFSEFSVLILDNQYQVKTCSNMLTHLGATPPLYLKIDDISGNCKRISTQFSEISLLIGRLGEKC